MGHHTQGEQWFCLGFLKPFLTAAFGFMYCTLYSCMRFGFFSTAAFAAYGRILKH